MQLLSFFYIFPVLRTKFKDLSSALFLNFLPVNGFRVASLDDGGNISFLSPGLHTVF